MTYTEFKKEHGKLICNIIFTETKQADILVEQLERLRLDNQKHYGRHYNEYKRVQSKR